MLIAGAAGDPVDSALFIWQDVSKQVSTTHAWRCIAFAMMTPVRPNLHSCAPQSAIIAQLSTQVLHVDPHLGELEVIHLSSASTNRVTQFDFACTGYRGVCENRPICQGRSCI